MQHFLQYFDEFPAPKKSHNLSARPPKVTTLLTACYRAKELYEQDSLSVSC